MDLKVDKTRKILGLIGSKRSKRTEIALRELSFNNSNIIYDIENLGEYEIEFADGRDYRDYNEDTQMLVKKIFECDAIVIGVPVYQSSIPGFFKNLLDLLPIDSIKDKIIGIVITAGSDKHYLVAEYQLKPVLSYMKADVIEKYVFIKDEDFINGKIIDDDILIRLEDLSYSLEEKLFSKDNSNYKGFSF